MRTTALVFTALLTTLTACSGGAQPAEEGSSGEPQVQAETEARAAEDVDPLEALRAHIEELAAKPEHEEATVTVRHILIGFKGAPRMTVQRSKEDAERLAASLFQRIGQGESFLDLVREFSDDPGPGVYKMRLKDDVMGEMARSDMVPAFGNVGWRLAVGEVGVAAHHPNDSPYGWHIVKRLK